MSAASACFLVMVRLHTMFSSAVNTPCNNALFSSRTMGGMEAASAMHPSANRLYRIAAQRGDLSTAAIAKRMNTSVQKIQNWESRGVSREGALHAQLVYGYDANWLLGLQGSAHLVPPVSQSEATLTHPSLARYQRVLVRGVAVVDAAGFWKELEQSRGDEYIEAATSDPDAYAVRVVGRRYYPVIDSGQCVLMSPAAPLKMSKRVLVRLADGRHTVRLYLNHQDGLWMFASLTDANDVLELRDDQVAAVERVMAVSDSE